MFYGVNKPEISSPKIKISKYGADIFLLTKQHPNNLDKIHLLEIWWKIR